MMQPQLGLSAGGPRYLGPFFESKGDEGGINRFHHREWLVACVAWDPNRVDSGRGNPERSALHAISPPTAFSVPPRKWFIEALLSMFKGVLSRPCDTGP
jgi:hypothetical protein